MPPKGSTRVEDFNTYRVIVTTYRPAQRTRKMLVPGKSERDAENLVRKRVPDNGGGYHFQTKKVADYWRERE